MAKKRAESTLQLLAEFDSNLWMTPNEVAARFGVDSKVVGKWEAYGKFVDVRTFKTLGGHNRYHKEDIEKAAQDIIDAMDKNEH